MHFDVGWVEAPGAEGVGAVVVGGAAGAGKPGSLLRTLDPSVDALAQSCIKAKLLRRQITNFFCAMLSLFLIL